MIDPRREIWFVDSSAFVASLNRHDHSHAAAIAAFKLASEKSIPLVTTNFVVAETHALLLNRIGHEPALRFLRMTVMNPVERVTLADEGRALDIIFRYTDKDFSMVDALSFAVMERLGIKTVLGFDRDFLQYAFAMAAP